MSSAAQHHSHMAPLAPEVGAMRKSVRFLLISAGAWLAWFLVGFVGGHLAGAAEAYTVLEVLSYVAIVLMLVGAATAIIGLALGVVAAWRWTRAPRPAK